jgi:hypothetical protein
VERSELFCATAALYVMDRDILTCAPAVADGVLALQLPGKSCGDSDGTPILNVSIRRSRKMSIKQFNYVTTASIKSKSINRIKSNQINSSFTSYPVILHYIASHTGRIVNSNINNTVKHQTS